MRSIRAFIFSEELQTRLQSDEEKIKDTSERIETEASLLSPPLFRIIQLILSPLLLDNPHHFWWGFRFYTLFNPLILWMLDKIID
jgi:hypothetical protein